MGDAFQPSFLSGVPKLTPLRAKQLADAFPDAAGLLDQERHNVVIAGITDIHGVDLTEYDFSFETDTIAPKVIASSITTGDVFTGSPQTITEVITFSEPIYWADGATLTLTHGGGSTPISASQVIFSSDRMTLTIPAAAHQMAVDGNYLLELQVLGHGALTPAQARRQGVHYKVRFRYPDAPARQNANAEPETEG